MKQTSSSRKVNEQAREVIASILLFEISDPRLSLVTITACEVSFDRSVCNVFYTTDKDRYDVVEAAFSKASGRIRSLMAKKLSWRCAPELRFMLDESVDNAERIARALANDEVRLNFEQTDNLPANSDDVDDMAQSDLAERDDTNMHQESAL